jgi:cytochrome c-type biogenesis protein
MNSASPDIFIAFLAGLLSFLSPCVFPLVPAYIGYLGGPTVMGAMSVASGKRKAANVSVAAATSQARWTALLHTFLFVLGFTFVFVVVIGGLAGQLSDLMRENRRLIQYIMGVVLVVFGLHMLRVINISFLDYTRRLEVRPTSNLGYFRSFFIGLGFAIGWTPCIGPTLTLMFNLVLNNQQSQAFPLFLAYSLGLGIPFLLAALAIGQVSSALKKVTRRTWTFRLGNWTVIDQANIMSLLSGVLLIVMGVLIFTNSLTFLSQYGPTIGNF